MAWNIVTNDMTLYAHWELEPDVWIYEVTDGKATILEYSSSATSIEISAELDGWPVTGIGTNAFRTCANLSSVIISEGITFIGERAFYGCGELTNVMFRGNAPSMGDNAFTGVNSSCVAWVSHTSSGWNVVIPGWWNGVQIRYYDIAVSFNLGGCGTRIGGGKLEQLFDCPSAAIEPMVMANDGWEFLGWDADFSHVASDMTVNALWRRVYSPGEALGMDAAIAYLPWTVGSNGVAEVKGYDDATAATGKSLKFAAADDSSSWVETVVTNACRVTFSWKSSCEGLLKNRPYDYLAFAVDGEQQVFICGETG